MEFLLGGAIIVIVGIVILVVILTNKKKKQNTEDISSVKSVPESSMEWDTGKTGERYAREALAPLVGYKRFLSNCYLPKPDGTFTEVDVILLHESGIYILEVKNYSGWIFGNENQRYWIQTLPSGKERSKSIRFFNPVIKNKVHLKWLKEYIGKPLPFYSYIVFSDRCEFKKVMPGSEHVVLNRRNLFYSIRHNAEVEGIRLTQEEIDSLYDKLYPLTQATEEQKAFHVQTIEQKKQSTPKPSSSQDKKCPRCGGDLVLRTAKKGERAGNQFWGCSNFPKCRFVEQIENTSQSRDVTL